MLEAFQASLARLGAVLHEVGPSGAGSALQGIVEAAGTDEADRPVVLWAPDPEGRVEDAVGSLDGSDAIELQRAGDLRGEAGHDLLGRAAVGVTRAELGIADRGVVAVEFTPAQDAVVSLAPPVQVALLREADLVPDSEAAFARLADAIRDGRGNWVLVAGPSTTVDMGLPVRGVHGPGEVHVVVERDEGGEADG